VPETALSITGRPVTGMGISMEENNGVKQYIMIVEDDGPLAAGLCRALQSGETGVSSCGNIKEAEKRLKAQTGQCDLVLLDVNLPDGNGFDFLKKIKEEYGVSVVMLTANDMEMDIVTGLESGADDYITKPFGVMELISRVKALLRRAGRTSEDAVLDFGTIKLDTERRICMVNGVNTELTFKEYELLKCFMSNAGLVLSRDKLMDTVWDSEFAGESRTIDMHVKTLRKKLGDAGGHIITVRNVGYKLE